MANQISNFDMRSRRRYCKSPCSGVDQQTEHRGSAAIDDPFHVLLRAGAIVQPGVYSTGGHS